MMRATIAMAAIFTAAGCSSIESATVSSSEVTAAGGDAIAVIQANSIGFTLLFHTIDVVSSDYDEVVNKLLISEAKALGATRVEVKSASTTPRHGIFAVFGAPWQAFPFLNIVGFPQTEVVGIAVK